MESLTVTQVSLPGSYFSTDQNPCSGLSIRQVLRSISRTVMSKMELAVMSSGRPSMTQAR